MCHCFEICNIFIIVLIFEGDSPSHFDTVTKKLIWIQISKVTCLLISPLFRKFWFHLKIWRQFTIMFCHWLSSIVDFTSTLEVDSPSYFAFVLKTLILLWISKTVHIIVFCYCSACLRFRPLFLDSSGATFAFAPNSFFSSSATFGKLFKKKWNENGMIFGRDGSLKNVLKNHNVASNNTFETFFSILMNKKYKKNQEK